MGGLDNNGSNGRCVYAHFLHGEYVVAVGVPREEAERRQVVVQPRQLVREPQQFVDDFVRKLIKEHGQDMVIPAHETTPDILWVGNPHHGLYVSVNGQYNPQLETVIDEVNKI